MRRLLILVSPLVAVPLVAAAPAAPVPKDDRTTVYFPTRVGDTRVSAYAGDTKEVTEVVTKVEDEDGGRTKIVTVETTEGKSRSTERWALSEKGLCQLPHDKDLFGEPLWVLKAPYSKGQRWEVEAGDRRLPQAIKGFEWVEVPAGRFWAVRVEVEYNEAARAISWYAAGLGRVKADFELPCMTGVKPLVLKSFKPGKD